MKFIKYISAVCLFFAVSTVSAQKIAYVNTQALLSSIPDVQEANANIETFQKQLQKKGQEMLAGLQTKYQSLEQQQANGEISPKQLEVEVAKLKEEEGKIMEFEQSSQQKIVDKSESLLGPIRQKIQTAIDDVASEGGFDYILDGSMGFILYADKSVDVSDQVKSKLGI